MKYPATQASGVGVREGGGRVSLKRSLLNRISQKNPGCSV